MDVAYHNNRTLQMTANLCGINARYCKSAEEAMIESQ